MAVKMRLSRKGRKKAPFYHIIVADARSPRDGKFIERIGAYNPMTKPATIDLDRDAAYDWLTKGAQPTDTVKAILRFKGVYYKKHLMRGVSKGAMTVEQADVLYQKWIDAKEGKIQARKAETIAELEAFRKMVSGEAKAKVIVADESTKEAAEAFRDVQEVEAPVAVIEEAPVVEEAPVSVTEEAPVVEETAVVEEAEVPAVAEDSTVEESKDEEKKSETKE
jgi:small subunit ribosomal protein S16